MDIHFKYQNPANLAHIIAQPFSLHFNVAGGVTQTLKNRLSKNPYFLVHDDQACVRLFLFSAYKKDLNPRSDPKDPIPNRADAALNL